MVFLAVGSLLLSGLLCAWISLTRLVDLDKPEAPAPSNEEKEDEESKQRLTKLGRPIVEVRLQA